MTLTKIIDGVEVPLTPEEEAAVLAEWAAPAPALTQADYAAAIQGHIDTTAKSKGYADGVALASYINSSMPSWQAEAAVFVPWRDSVWVAAYNTLGAVQQGAQPPTIAQLIASIPVIAWPS